MTEKHSPLPWKIEGPDMFGDYNILHPAEAAAIGAVVSNLRSPEEVAANAALIVRSVNGLPEAIAALEDLQQKAGVVATWLNHWDVPFASEDEWRGPTGDGQLFFDALNRAAAALTKLKG